MYSTTTGGFNSAFGDGSLLNNTTGYWNTAIGWNTLYSNTTGYRNSVFGYRAMVQNTTGTFNTAIGENAMESNQSGSENIVVGGSALNANTIGNRNVAVGWQALAFNTSASGNVAVGYQTMHDNLTGDQNSALGYWALKGNSTGTSNSAFGYKSMEHTITGSSNSAFGSYALDSNSSGSYNSAFGNKSLEQLTSGNGNSAFGFTALQSLKSGGGNTAIGNSSMSNVTVGDFNTALGEGSGYGDHGVFNTSIGVWSGTADSLTNATSIGFSAFATESNSIQLGDSQIQKVRTSGSYYGNNFIGKGGKLSDSSSIGSSAILELSSNTKGLLYPRMTELERNNISQPQAGLALYCIDCGDYGELQVYNGSFWTNFVGDSAKLGSGWSNGPMVYIYADRVSPSNDVTQADLGNHLGEWMYNGSQYIISGSIIDTLADGLLGDTSIQVNNGELLLLWKGTLSSLKYINKAGILNLTAINPAGSRLLIIYPNIQSLADRPTEMWNGSSPAINPILGRYYLYFKSAMSGFTTSAVHNISLPQGIDINGSQEWGFIITTGTAGNTGAGTWYLRQDTENTP